MNPLLNKVSKGLNIAPEELLSRGLLAYLEHELRLAEEDIADIRDKYFVVSKEALTTKIKNKKIASHPAWEDIIVWENTEKYMTKLKNEIQRLK